MIKTAALVSLFLMMLNQAHAVEHTFEQYAALPSIPLGECVLKKAPVAANTVIAPDSVLGKHLQANASKIDCVKNMHANFLKHLDDAGQTWLLQNLVNANTAKDIPKSILKAFDAGICGRIINTPVASGLTVDQIKELPNACLNDDVAIGKLSKAQVQAIVPKNNEAGQPATAFLGHENFRKHMTDGQLKTIVGNEFEGCKSLDPVKLLKVNPATLAKLDHRCFKNLDWNVVIDEAEGKKLARLVGTEAFKELPSVGLPAQLVKALRPSHLKDIDASNKEDPCTKLDLTHLPEHLSGSVNKTCFKNALEGVTNGGGLKPFFFHFAGKDLFSGFKESDDIKELIKVPQFWSALQKEHYADILKHDTDVCESIKFDNKDKAFTYAADLSAECFAKMPEDTKTWILKKYSLVLKDDILSKLDSTHGTHLESAIRTLGATRPSLLRHFGAGEPSGENVCSAYKITQLKDHKDLKRAGQYFPDNCVKTMINEAADEDVQYTELSKYPKNVVALFDMTKLLANLSDSALSGMDEAKWKAFVGPITCKGLTYEQFGHVPSDVAYKFMSVGCLDELTFLDTLASNQEADVKHIPIDVIKAAKAKTIGALATALGEDQIKVLGANASGLGDEAFENLSVAQVGALSAQGIAGLPVGAFKTVKEDKWVAIKPDSLVSISHAQLDAVPQDILLHTTEKQAGKIPVEAVKAFDKCHDKLPPAVKGALKEEPKEEPKKEEPKK